MPFSFAFASLANGKQRRLRATRPDMRELVLRRGTTKWQTLSCEEDDSGGGGCEGMREREHDNDVATAGRVTYGDRPDQAPRLQHRRTHIQPAREDNDSGPALRAQNTGRRPNCSRWLIEATRNTHTHRSVASSRLRRRGCDSHLQSRTVGQNRSCRSYR